MAKNTAHVFTLLALSNLWMVRRKVMAMMDRCVPNQLRAVDEGRSLSMWHPAVRFMAIHITPMGFLFRSSLAELRSSE